MAETRTRSIRVSDDVWEAIQGLPGKTDEALRAILIEQRPDPLGEILELVQGLPGAEEIGVILRRVVMELKAERVKAPEASFAPTSVPGVHRGMPRESSSDRAARERRERQERALALDVSGGERDDIDRSDDFVSG